MKSALYEICMRLTRARAGHGRCRGQTRTTAVLREPLAGVFMVCPTDCCADEASRGGVDSLEEFRCEDDHDGNSACEGQGASDGAAATCNLEPLKAQGTRIWGTTHVRGRAACPAGEGEAGWGGGPPTGDDAFAGGEVVDEAAQVVAGHRQGAGVAAAAHHLQQLLQRLEVLLLEPGDVLAPELLLRPAAASRPLHAWRCVWGEHAPGPHIGLARPTMPGASSWHAASHKEMRALTTRGRLVTGAAAAAAGVALNPQQLIQARRGPGGGKEAPRCAWASSPCGQT